MPRACIQQGIADVYNDFSSGDAEVIGRRVGKLVGDIILGIITTKGVDKAVKAIRASAEAGTLAALMGELKSGLKNVDNTIKKNVFWNKMTSDWFTIVKGGQDFVLLYLIMRVMHVMNF